MSVCDWNIYDEANGRFYFRCRRCLTPRDWTDLKYIRQCSVEGPPVMGVGTTLTAILDERRIHPEGCRCVEVALELNARGIDWCRNNIPTVVAMLEANRQKLGLLDQADAAAKLAAAGYFSFNILVREAIKRAEAKADS